MCFCEKFYNFFQVSLTLLSLLAIYAYVAFVTLLKLFTRLSLGPANRTFCFRYLWPTRRIILGVINYACWGGFTDGFCQCRNPDRCPDNK